MNIIEINECKYYRLNINLKYSPIKFKIENSKDINEISCFTTRPDTLFGLSFLALSVDHPIANLLCFPWRF